MTRNLDRRVEVACPVYDSDIKAEINKVIETTLQDNIKIRLINNEGEYYKLSKNKESFISQDLFIQQALELEPYKITKNKSIINIIKRLLKM